MNTIVIFHPHSSTHSREINVLMFTNCSRVANDLGHHLVEEWNNLKLFFLCFPMVFPMVSYGLPPPFDPIFHGSMWLDTGSCQATYTFSGFRVGQPTMVSGPELLHGKQNPYPMTDPWQYAILMVCHLPSTYPSHVSIYIYTIHTDPMGILNMFKDRCCFQPFRMPEIRCFDMFLKP